jgi:hypothetical protein
MWLTIRTIFYLVLAHCIATNIVAQGNENLKMMGSFIEKADADTLKSFLVDGRLSHLFDLSKTTGDYFRSVYILDPRNVTIQGQGFFPSCQFTGFQYGFDHLITDFFEDNKGYFQARSVDEVTFIYLYVCQFEVYANLRYGYKQTHEQAVLNTEEQYLIPIINWARREVAALQEVISERKLYPFTILGIDLGKEAAHFLVCYRGMSMFIVWHVAQFLIKSVIFRSKSTQVGATLRWRRSY